MRDRNLNPATFGIPNYHKCGRKISTFLSVIKLDLFDSDKSENGAIYSKKHESWKTIKCLDNYTLND